MSNRPQATDSVLCNATLLESFRKAMVGVCTPVSVVTTVERGRPHGTTVSAFASLSMEPPMVLVSLDRGSELLFLVERTGQFGLNVLASDQSAEARRFAGKGAEKFEGAQWTLDRGAARLDGAAVWVACSVAAIFDGGDHRILLGDVVCAETTQIAPLTYHARTFGTHLAHPAES